MSEILVAEGETAEVGTRLAVLSDSAGAAAGASAGACAAASAESESTARRVPTSAVSPSGTRISET
ncbi:MAG: hypothetical protein ACRDY4_09380 [Acidimicrobiia bacterium]